MCWRLLTCFIFSASGGDEEADSNVTIRSGGEHRQLPSDNEPQTTNYNVSYFYNSSHTNHYLPLNNLSNQEDNQPVLTKREILIITLTSIVAVILVVIAAVVVIWKVEIFCC